MKHYIEEDLLQYIDGGYGNDSEARVRAHLKECPQCLALYQELSVLDKHLSQMPPEQPSAHFKAAIISKLYSATREEAGMNFNFFGQYLMIFGIAVSILAFLISIVSLGFLDTAVLQPTGLAYEIISDSPGLTEWISSSATLEMISKGLLGACIIMVLIVLDKALLTPYFKKRRDEKMALSR